MLADPENPRISARKAPRQARSAQLVADILEAAARVLAEDGAHRFTTARVAERAGVSVGSLYQYFPNKAAILFRLQSDEWQETGALMRGILSDPAVPPFERLRRLVHAFVRSECEEAEMRIALDDAAPYYRNAPEAQVPRLRGNPIVQAFMAEALPGCTAETREIAGSLVMMTLADTGKRLSEDCALAGQIETYSDALADMFVTYLERLRTDAAPAQ